MSQVSFDARDILDRLVARVTELTEAPGPPDRAAQEVAFEEASVALALSVLGHDKIPIKGGERAFIQERILGQILHVFGNGGIPYAVSERYCELLAEIATQIAGDAGFMPDPTVLGTWRPELARLRRLGPETIGDPATLYDIMINRPRHVGWKSRAPMRDLELVIPARVLAGQAREWIAKTFAKHAVELQPDRAAAEEELWNRIGDLSAGVFRAIFTPVAYISRREHNTLPRLVHPDPKHPFKRYEADPETDREEIKVFRLLDGKPIGAKATLEEALGHYRRFAVYDALFGRLLENPA